MFWLVSIFPLVSHSPSLFSKSLGSVPNASSSIDINLIFMFLDSGVCIFFAFFYFHSMICWNDKANDITSYFLLVNTRCSLLTRISWSICISNPKEFYGSHFLVCVYTICQQGQILISCIIFSISPYLPNHICSCISFVLVFAFAYYVINCFIYITTELTLAIFLRILNICYNVIATYITWQVFKFANTKCPELQVENYFWFDFLVVVWVNCSNYFIYNAKRNVNKITIDYDRLIHWLIHWLIDWF